MLELTEEGAKNLIKSESKIFILLYMDTCKSCAEYKPFVLQAEPLNKDYKFAALKISSDLNKSAFAKTYFGDQQKVDFPQSVIFRDGKITDKIQGKFNAEQITQFISSGNVTAFKPVGDEILRGLNGEKFLIDKELKKAQNRYRELQFKIEVTQEEAEEGGQCMNIIEQESANLVAVNNKIADRLEKLQKENTNEE